MSQKSINRTNGIPNVGIPFLELDLVCCIRFSVLKKVAQRKHCAYNVRKEL